MLVLIAVSLPIFVIMAALAVNVAYMELVRTELRMASDFAARAGARQLSLTGRESDAFREIEAIGAAHEVAGQPLTIAVADVDFGKANRLADGSFIFQVSNQNPNAARVRGNRTGANSVGLFFGNVLSTNKFEPSLTSVAAQIDRDVAVVLDRSGSMAKKSEDGTKTEWQSGDPAPENSRWTKAVAGVLSFIAALEATPMDEQVSLITYNGGAIIDYDLMLSYSPMEPSLDTYTQSYVEGMTNIADGIEHGRRSLVERGYDRPWASKTIVVLTDGIHNAGDEEPIDAAARAAADGVIVHSITFGNDADQVQMQSVASFGNGQHWHAPNSQLLIRAFNEIADNSPTMLIE
jgi:hypothetical protein